MDFKALFLKECAAKESSMGRMHKAIDGPGSTLALDLSVMKLIEDVDGSIPLVLSREYITKENFGNQSVNQSIIH